MKYLFSVDNSLRLSSVNLERNGLTALPGSLFIANVELSSLNLKDNRFICDGGMTDFRIWMNDVMNVSKKYGQ